MEQEYKYMVCVRCMTYNHASYIADAFNGFTIQETSFPYVCVIVDDASTDGEPDIIKDYLQKYFDLEDNSTVRNEETDDYILTFAQHKTNKNCYFAVLCLKYNHYSVKKAKPPYRARWENNSKYIALCEGDDYWIDPQKLQLQVDYLESHPDIHMCGHAYNLFYNDEHTMKGIHSLDHSDILDPGWAIENKRMPQTATLVFRARLYYDRPPFFNKLSIGDYSLRIFYAINGGIYYIDKVMSTYRRFSAGCWTLAVKKKKDEYISFLEQMRHFAMELDNYTDFKYHLNVMNMTDRLDCLMYKTRGNLLKIVQSKYFNSLNIKNKLRFLFEK